MFVFCFGVCVLKVKALLRFYFSADALERHLNNLIYKRALRSFAGSCAAEAEEVIGIISAKEELSLLWDYLDGVLSAMPPEDVSVLKGYARMRRGIARLSAEEQRAVRRAAVKFTRRAGRGLVRYRRAVCILSSLYCML